MKKGSAEIQIAGMIIGLVFTPVYGVAAKSMMNQGAEVEVATTLPGKDFQFAVRAGVGYITGEINEYVYEPTRLNRRLSGLSWELDNILMGKIGASIKYKNWLTVIMDSWWKLADSGGTMDDYDWTARGEEWTHWSNSNADITSASIFDVSANISFFQKDNCVLHGIFGLKRDNFEVIATGGDYIYSINSFRDSTGSFAEVPGVTYEQTMTVPYIGVGFVSDFSSNINLSGRLIFSPLVNGEATDQHHMRNLVTEDEVRSGNMFAADVSVGWKFRRDLLWDITIGYQKYETTKGDSIYFFNDTGKIYTYEDGIGMDQELTKFSTGLTYIF